MRLDRALVKTDTIAVAMLILVSCLLFFITALALVILKIYRPTAQYAWLVAIGGGILAFTSVFLWIAQTPFSFTLPAWQPERIFGSASSFRADEASWPYAISIAAVTLTILLTAVAHIDYSNSFSWAGSLALAGLGILAVTADNPVTLILVWAALDLVELITQLGSVHGTSANEKVVTAFSTRVLGIGVLVWANVISSANGNVFSFETMPQQAGLYLILAAGLRMGVLPLHLPYPAESSMRRGIGTSLRLISAASSLSLLEHVPDIGGTSIFAPVLFIFAIVAALYGGWNWLIAPEELTGRPFWIIGVASLSVLSALSGNPTGSVGWGCALLLLGAPLFVGTIHHNWLNRFLLVGAFGLSSLPFSLTASVWVNNLGLYYPFVVIAQALIIAGYIRHVQRSSGKEAFDMQPNWIRMIYPPGIGLLIGMQILLGLIGWNGARQIGAWLLAIIASALTLGLLWAIPRFRIFNPVRAHWVNPAEEKPAGAYSFLWGGYRVLGQVTKAVTSTLEGDGGIMWTLVFLIVFVSILTQGTP